MGYVRNEQQGSFVWEDESAAAEKPAARRFPWEIVALGVAVVAFVAWWGVRSLKDSSESIRRIRSHPAHYDGQSILLKGRVGEVFDMGGSCAYYLLQGRDTIVVFTRGKRPMLSQAIRVRGSISMGYLDGVPRPALFASGEQP